MRHYIAGGKDEVREIEAEALENQPPLFTEYLAAPPSERAIMDNQFKNMKTNARLQSKSGWYSWRTQLLHDLMEGLKETSGSLDKDEAELVPQEEMVRADLPKLQTRHDMLEKECARMRDHAARFAGTDKKQLQTVRKRLIRIDDDIHERELRVQELRRSVEAAKQKIRQLVTQKADCREATEVARLAAEEPGTGWTAADVKKVKGKLPSLVSISIATSSRSIYDELVLTLSFR